MSADQRDFLDEILDERSERNPEFTDLVLAALERRAVRPEPAVTAPGPAANDEPPRRRRVGAEALEER